MIDHTGLTRIMLNAARSVRYTVADSAPGTFPELVRASSLVVWSGGSDNTIYECSAANWAFRAVHDAIHLKLNAPFTLEGELYVARYQASLMPSIVGDIIIAEVEGQALHFAKYGAFPVNQRNFIENYLKTGTV